MLAQINYQVDVKIGLAMAFEGANLELRVPPVLFVLHEPDSVAHEASLNSPLDKSGHSEASIAAWYAKEAVADAPVEDIENAKTARHTFHFSEEANVDQQVVVEQVEADQNNADWHKYKALQILAITVHFLLVCDAVKEPHSTGKDKYRPNCQKC